MSSKRIWGYPIFRLTNASNVSLTQKWPIPICWRRRACRPPCTCCSIAGLFISSPMWCCAPDCLGVDQRFTHGSARTWWSMSRTAFCHMPIFASIDLYKLTLYTYIICVRSCISIAGSTLSSMLRQVRISQKLLQVKPKFQKFGALGFMRSPACWKNRASIGSMHIIFGPWPWMQYSASLSPVRAPPCTVCSWQWPVWDPCWRAMADGTMSAKFMKSAFVGHLDERWPSADLGGGLRRETGNPKKISRLQMPKLNRSATKKEPGIGTYWNVRTGNCELMLIDQP